jgi:hypothetical protein
VSSYLSFQLRRVGGPPNQLVHHNTEKTMLLVDQDQISRALFRPRLTASRLLVPPRPGRLDLLVRFGESSLGCVDEHQMILRFPWYCARSPWSRSQRLPSIPPRSGPFNPSIAGFRPSVGRAFRHSPGRGAWFGRTLPAALPAPPHWSACWDTRDPDRLRPSSASRAALDPDRTPRIIAL